MRNLIGLILLLVLAVPFAFAQKPLVNAVRKQAEKVGLKASKRDLQELEKRFAILCKDPSRTSMERVSMLLKNRVEKSPQRDELEELFLSGQYAQAQARVHWWLTGEELVEKPARQTQEQIRESFVNRFLSFDLYKGEELKQAVHLLQAGRQSKLVTSLEYQNILWSLSQLDFRNVNNIVSRSGKAVIRGAIHKPQYEKALLQLSKMYEWEDLHSRPLAVPPVDQVSRREAIRQVLGPLAGGKKQPLSAHQAYYEQLPPWRQQELDGQIDQMEQLIKQRVAQASVQNKGHLEKHHFSAVFARFVTGKVRTSYTVIKVLYSPYVSEESRRKTESALSGMLSFGQALKTGETLFTEYAQNFEKGQIVCPDIQTQVLSPFYELQDYLSKHRQWPQEGSSLFTRLQELELQPGLKGAQLMLTRLKQQSPPEKAVYDLLQQYVAQHHRLPPSTSSLYHSMQRYKKIPGPYQQGFQDLFEKYRVAK